VLVATELEVRKRVGSVAADELRGGPAHIRIGERARRRQRPEEQVGAPQQREDPGQSHRLVEPPELVVEDQRAGLPEQRVTGLTEHCRQARALRSAEPDGQRAEQEASCGDERCAPERGTQAHRVLPDGERATAEPENAGKAEARGRFLEVEALGEVEGTEAEQQHERQPERALSTAPQVERGREQPDRYRHCQGVRDADGLERLHLQERPMAPRDVRRSGRGEIDERRERGADRHQLRERVRPPNDPQRSRLYVQAQAPEGGVPRRRDEVAPVLHQEPDSQGPGHPTHSALLEPPGRDGHAESEQQSEAEVPLVHPGAEQVDARPEAVTLDAQHAHIIRIRAADASQNRLATVCAEPPRVALSIASVASGSEARRPCRRGRLRRDACGDRGA
jgi:hypothetical protein